MKFITNSVDYSLIQRYEQAFADKYPTHRARAEAAFRKGEFLGYKVFIDGEKNDFGGLILEPRRMMHALADLMGIPFKNA